MANNPATKKTFIALLNAVSIDSARTACLSGGDRILIEFTRRWLKYFANYQIITCNSGVKILQKYLKWEQNLKFIVLKIPAAYYQNLIKLYLCKTWKACSFLFHYKFPQNTYLYSSSDFWPDTFPAFLAKLKNPQITWIAGFYLFSPTPWQQDSPYRTNLKRWLIGLGYWLTQLPMYWLVKHHADLVWVTSQPDVEKFITTRRPRSKIAVIQGGVDIAPSEKYFAQKQIIPVQERKYDACFVGRFHYQKGVLELIEIWKRVSRQKPQAKLAMIGVGPLEQEIRKKIKKYKLTKNIDLLGFRDGQSKYKIFQQSKMMVHPATYDSGGMAAAEGMAWRLPAVSFDLEALKTYYPQGMVKTPVGNLDLFAQNVLKLLNDANYYTQVAQEGARLIREVWDWEIRSQKILNTIFA